MDYSRACRVRALPNPSQAKQVSARVPLGLFTTHILSNYKSTLLFKGILLFFKNMQGGTKDSHACMFMRWIFAIIQKILIFIYVNLRPH